MNRRHFLKTAGAGAAALPLMAQAEVKKTTPVPAYLSDYADLYAADPKKAALAWFAKADYGLFMHYGLYSIIADGEWVMFHKKIPVAEYEKYTAQFTAEKFDADFITDMALEAGMRYVNITARHHDSFCLFESKQSDYNSMNTPAKRDLIGELAEQCAKKKLGFFLYYSYALDWHHPYFYPRMRFPTSHSVSTSME